MAKILMGNCLLKLPYSLGKTRLTKPHSRKRPRDAARRLQNVIQKLQKYALFLKTHYVWRILG